MPEAEEDNRSNNTFTKGPPATEELPVMMTMDLDLNGSWTFDQIFSSDPSPSFILSATEQSFSPLWAFSDENNNNELNDGDEKLAGTATLTYVVPAHRLLSDNGDHVTRKSSNNDIKRQLSMPILEVSPSEYQDATCVIRERMTMALRYFIELGENTF